MENKIPYGIWNKRHDVMEIFSMPRVCPEAARRGLVATESIDLMNGWDLLLADKRQLLMQKLGSCSWAGMLFFLYLYIQVELTLGCSWHGMACSWHGMI